MNFEVAQVVRILVLTTVSFLTAVALTPVLSHYLYKYRMGKQIRTEGAPVFAQLHAKKAGTPTMGGILIWLTTLAVAFIFWLLSLIFDGFWDYFNFVDRAQTYLPLVALVSAALFGLADDLLGVFKVGSKGGGLEMRQKIILYLFVALIGASWFYFRLGWDVLHIPFFGDVSISWWYIPLFIFIVVASAFSTNETDGLDGLAGGVMLTAFAALTVVAFVQGRYHLASFTGVIAGALLAFLWFNIYPARFFMGDTGSMSLGITLGVIVMLTNTTLLLPFFAFILVMESVSVILQVGSKKLFGKKIFISTPIHHHFEAIGWPETQVTMRFWIISALVASMGLVLFFLDRFL